MLTEAENAEAMAGDHMQTRIGQATQFRICMACRRAISRRVKPRRRTSVRQTRTGREDCGREYVGRRRRTAPQPSGRSSVRMHPVIAEAGTILAAGAPALPRGVVRGYSKTQG